MSETRARYATKRGGTPDETSEIYEERSPITHTVEIDVPLLIVQRTHSHPDTGTMKYGGYFVVELNDEGFDVELREIGDLERKECDRHGERGVQFRPADGDCIYCDDQRTLWRDTCASSFYGLTANSNTDSVDEDELVEYAVGLWDDLPSGFRDDFMAYLSDIDADRYAPLTRTDTERFAVAERSYMCQ